MGIFKSLFSKISGNGSKDPADKRKNVRSVPASNSIILVVDDSRTVRAILSKMLRTGGFQTLEAEDGQSAIEMAVEHQPSLIIMDVVMPGMSGFQATRKLHKNPETKHIPILIMSGNEQAIEQFWIIRIGAADFIAKPFTRFEVYRRVEKILFDNEII